MTLNTPATRRLAAYREQAAKSAAAIGRNYPNAHPAFTAAYGSGDWRKSRYPSKPYAGSWGEEPKFHGPSDRPYYAPNFPKGWRDHGTAFDVSRREGSRAVSSRGWYCDDMQHETVSGHVLQLPARGGVPQYVPAISWSDQEGVTLWPLDRYDSAVEAARAADGYAERQAEVEREYREVTSARDKFDSLAEELAELKRQRRDMRNGLAELRGNRGAAFTIARRQINAGLAASLERTEEAQREAAELESNFSHHDGWKA